jgi:Zn-dependent oligopeptidase
LEFGATFAALANADGQASLVSAELTIPALVNGDGSIRAASSNAKKQLQHMWARTYSRPDLYQCLRAAQDGATTEEDSRLVHQVLSKFQQAGASLPTAEERAKVCALDAECASLAFEIEQNINEDCTKVVLTEAELEGCSEGFIQGLPFAEGRNGTPSRLCSVKAPVLVPVLKRGRCPEGRRKLLTASRQQCMDTNAPLLDRLVVARDQAACTLGFSSHAQRMLAPKMAATPDAAEAFCRQMLARLGPVREAEMQRLEARKAADAAVGEVVPADCAAEVLTLQHQPLPPHSQHVCVG